MRNSKRKITETHKDKHEIIQRHKNIKKTRILILCQEDHEKPQEEQTLRIKEATVNRKTWKSRGAKVMLACYAILKGLFCSLSR